MSDGEYVSKFDAENMREIIGGHGDWFSADLYRLIHKADKENKARLYIAFPLHVETYERWYYGGCE